jgi:hypothetical protein
MVKPLVRSGKNSTAVTLAVLVNTLGRELDESELELLPEPPDPLVWANAVQGAKASAIAAAAPIRHDLPMTRRALVVRTQPPVATSGKRKFRHSQR